MATQFALRLFFRPLNFPVPEREKPLREKATFHKMTTGKSEFFVLSWGDSPRKVLFMHGWSGRGTQFFKMIEKVVSLGYQAVAIEAPAHGKSLGKKTHLLEFRDCVLEVSRQFGPFAVSIGHSLGGMAIFNALENGHETGVVISVGTPATIQNVVMDFADQLGASPAIGKRIIQHIEKQFSMNTSHASTDYLAALHNPQGLVVHDLNDQDVSVEDAHELHRSWPLSNLLITKGKGHRRVLMEESVIDAIIGFLPPN